MGQQTILKLVFIMLVVRFKTPNKSYVHLSVKLLFIVQDLAAIYNPQHIFYLS